MEKRNKKYLIVIACLSIVTCYSLLIFKPSDRSFVAQRLKEFPRNFGKWEFIRDVEMQEQIISALDPSSIVFREYRNPEGKKMWLCVVYHQNDRWGAHDPQVCYKSQGWDIANYGGKYETTQIHIKETDVDINRFYVSKGGFKEVVYYWWFGSKKKQMTTRFEQMLDLAINGALYGYNDSGFIRISINLEEGHEDECKKAGYEFAKAISSLIVDYLPD